MEALRLYAVKIEAFILAYERQNIEKMKPDRPQKSNARYRSMAGLLFPMPFRGYHPVKITRDEIIRPLPAP